MRPGELWSLSWGDVTNKDPDHIMIDDLPNSVYLRMNDGRIICFLEHCSVCWKWFRGGSIYTSDDYNRLFQLRFDRTLDVNEIESLVYNSVEIPLR